MKENEQIISNFPEALQKEYQELTDTKQDFLAKVRGAAKAELVTLYEELEEVWKQMDLESYRKA